MARGRKSSWRVVMSPDERQTLERWQRSTTMATGLARRGKILLLLAAGYSQAAVAQVVGVQRTGWYASGPRGFSPSAWLAWLMPLATAPRVVFPPAVALHVVRLACERPDTLSRSLSQWDGTELAHQLIAEGIVEDISAGTVRRILACHHLKPWRHHLWLHPRQPRGAAFYATIMKLIDLYTRPRRADEMVLSVDEKTSL